MSNVVINVIPKPITSSSASTGAQSKLTNQVYLSFFFVGFLFLFLLLCMFLYKYRDFICHSYNCLQVTWRPDGGAI